MMNRCRIVLVIAALSAGGVARAGNPDECRTGGAGQYVVWNFDLRTAALFDPTEIEDELKKINSEASKELGSNVAPVIKASLCKDEALLKKLLSEHDPADLGDFVLVALLAQGRDFEVRIVPYIVNRDRPRLITHWECTQGGPVPTVNAYRREIRTYAYAALALSEIRRVESLRDPCRARHAQFFLERALSALATRSVSTASDWSPGAELQSHLEEKRRWLGPMIEAAAKTANRCDMPPESSHLAELLRPP